MRIKIMLGSDDSEKQLLLNKNIKPVGISFLKTIYSKSPVFNNLYNSDKKRMPFCSALYLGKNMKIAEDYIITDSPITFFFSTGRFDIYSYFINGCMDFMNEGKMILLKNNQRLKITKIEPLPSKTIGKKITIKTMSPFVLQNPKVDRKDFKNFYVTAEHDSFESVLNEVTEKRMAYLGIKGFSPIKIKTNKSKIDQIPHYKGYVRATRGEFELVSSIKTLQFLYDYGIGTRTGQLFGMFRIL